MTAAAGWTAERLSVRDAADGGAPDVYLEHLAESGALDEAEQIFDAIDSGENPCVGITFDELKRQVDALHI